MTSTAPQQASFCRKQYFKEKYERSLRMHDFTHSANWPAFALEPKLFLVLRTAWHFSGGKSNSQDLLSMILVFQYLSVIKRAKWAQHFHLAMTHLIVLNSC